MECGSAKRTRLAAIEAAKEAAKEAHVYPVTLKPGQVTVTEQLMFAEECAKEVFAAERALMMTAQEGADQTKINCASSLCGAKGCGKGNIGQFESRNRAAMRQHCATNKHMVLDYAQLCFVVVFTKVYCNLCYNRKIYVVFSCSRNETKRTNL